MSFARLRGTNFMYTRARLSKALAIVTKESIAKIAKLEHR
jgi:hypothetical protein